MHRPMPCLEALEGRDCPSVTLQFDYRYDTRGFFDAPARRAALQRAGDTLDSQLTDHLAAIAPGGANHWVASFPNPQSGAR